jgi:hypothetical protein
VPDASCHTVVGLPFLDYLGYVLIARRKLTRLRGVWLFAGAALTAAIVFSSFAAVPPQDSIAVKGPMPQDKRVPVIVELFTSEGCNSCPPADALLAKFDQEQPISGVEIIPMEEHVDYWDNLGWRDPFSSRALTTRQTDYSRQLHVDDVYTPQAVINGQAQVLGSDARQMREAITRAAKGAKAVVDVEFQSTSIACDVMLAVTENKLETNVTAGENRGRRMAHTGVVRTLVSLGRVQPSSPASFSMHLRFSPQWKRDNLKYVVFVQDRTTRKIFGATAVTP